MIGLRGERPAHNYARPVEKQPSLRREVLDTLSNDCNLLSTQTIGRASITPARKTPKKFTTSCTIKPTTAEDGKTAFLKEQATASLRMVHTTRVILLRERQKIGKDIWCSRMAHLIEDKSGGR
jgi:hypothetical protein